MKPTPTYKAVFHLSYGLEKTVMILKAMAWIHENDAEHTYVNFYANDDELVFVQNDRDAAIKLKLALT